MRRLALVAPLLAILAACGGGHARTVTSTRAGPVGAPSSTPTACSVYDRSSNEYIEVIAAGADAGCLSIVKRWSSSGAFWSLYPGGVHNRYSQDSLDCSMRHAGVELDVYDDGWATNGNSTCGVLAARGWQQVG